MILTNRRDVLRIISPPERVIATSLSTYAVEMHLLLTLQGRKSARGFRFARAGTPSLRRT